MNTAQEAASTSLALGTHPPGNPALGKARRRVASFLGGSNVTIPKDGFVRAESFSDTRHLRQSGLGERGQ